MNEALKTAVGPLSKPSENSGRLYISCGLPGSGKTTWLKNNFTGKVVSRDDIRFEMLKEGEDYFAHEDEVFDTFVTTIAENIYKGEDTVADATHLNKNSRLKLLAALAVANSHPKEISAIYFTTPLEECLKRNANRQGTKFFVPEKTIRNMARSYRPPIANAFYSKVFSVDMAGEMSLCV